MKRTTTFTKGSGCYKCTSCGRLTRDNGDRDAVNVRQCGQCYEAAGIDNLIQDGEASAADVARFEALKAQIASLGGTY